MENASKALIIAGSILVSIVIITLGVMIVSGVTDTIQQHSNLSGEEILAYNSQFTAYEGTKSGTQVRALCDLIRNHNGKNTEDSTRNVSIQTGTAPESANALDEVVTAKTVTDFRNTIKSGKTYEVTFSYDSHSGLIVGAYVNEKK